jgi:hypothetical protein
MCDNLMVNFHHTDIQLRVWVCSSPFVNALRDCLALERLFAERPRARGTIIAVEGACGDINLSRTSCHKERVLGWNSISCIFGCFLEYFGLSGLMFQNVSSEYTLNRDKG